MEIMLRPMTDGDLSLFEKWLSHPYVAKWYHNADDWINEFKSRETEFAFIHYFIAQSNGTPLGFCQYYALRDSGEDMSGYAPLSDAYSIDYLVGEKEYLRRGIGKQIVYALIEKIKAHPDAKRIVVQPERGNTASRRLLLACGFSYDNEKDLFVKLIDGQ